MKGKWFYLYQAVNQQGQTLAFYLSKKRSRHYAHQFLKRCLRYYPLELQPQTLNTNKHSSYARAISHLKKQGKLRQYIQQRQMKCLNNGIETDRTPIKN